MAGRPAGVTIPEIKERIPTGFVGSRSFEIQNLWGKHREMLRRVALGQSNLEIAEAMGICPQTVAQTRNSRLGRAHFERLEEKLDDAAIVVAKEIKRLAPSAIATMCEVMNDPESPAAVRIKAAADILDRAGFGAVKTVNVGVTHGTFTPADIADMKARAKEAGAILPAQV